MELLNQMDGFDQNVNVKVQSASPPLTRQAMRRSRSIKSSDGGVFHLRMMAVSAWQSGWAVRVLAVTSLCSGAAARVASRAAQALGVCVQVIMATNRADTLDPALLRPGRLDRKIEFPMPDRRQKRLVFQVSLLQPSRSLTKGCHASVGQAMQALSMQKYCLSKFRGLKPDTAAKPRRAR